MSERAQETEVREYLFEDDGSIPNNLTLPLLVYSQALDSSEQDSSAARNCWRRMAGAALGWTGSSPIITTTRMPTRCFAW